jgi:hypothetical protein
LIYLSAAGNTLTGTIPGRYKFLLFAHVGGTATFASLSMLTTLHVEGPTFSRRFISFALVENYLFGLIPYIAAPFDTCKFEGEDDDGDVVNCFDVAHSPNCKQNSGGLCECLIAVSGFACLESIPPTPIATRASTPVPTGAPTPAAIHTTRALPPSVTSSTMTTPTPTPAFTALSTVSTTTAEVDVVTTTLATPVVTALATTIMAPATTTSMIAPLQTLPVGSFPTPSQTTPVASTEPSLSVSYALTSSIVRMPMSGVDNVVASTGSMSSLIPVIGAVVGAVCLCLIVVGIIAWCTIRRRRTNVAANEDNIGMRPTTLPASNYHKSGSEIVHPPYLSTSLDANSFSSFESLRANAESKGEIVLRPPYSMQPGGTMPRAPALYGADYANVGARVGGSLRALPTANYALIRADNIPTLPSVATNSSQAPYATVTAVSSITNLNSPYVPLVSTNSRPILRAPYGQSMY